MRVGIGEVEVTPSAPLPLAGMPGFRVGRGVESPLMCRVVVLDDGDQRVALVTLDLLLMLSSTAAEVRDVVGQRGIDPWAVLVSCSHTHSAPYVASLMDGDPDPGFLDHVLDKVGLATDRACGAMTSAVIRVGSAAGTGLSFNRRPVYNLEREEVGTQGPHWVPGFVRVEGPTYEHAQFLWFNDRDGAGLGGVASFACHPTVVAAAEDSKELYSADFVGTFTSRLRDEFGGPFAFLQGAAGNLWAIDMSQPETANRYGVSSARGMGESLAKLGQQARIGARDVIEPRVRAARRVLRIPLRTVNWEQVRLARDYLERGEGRSDEVAFTRAMYGHPYTFYSNSALIQEWFCREAIGMWEWQRRATARMPLVEEVEVQVITIGDVAIVGYPCELFVEHGLRTKTESPFVTTMVAELANGWFGYVPTLEAFQHGGYETRLGYQSRLDPTAGDQMVHAALELLKELA